MPALKRKWPGDDDDTGITVEPIVVDESEEGQPGIMSKPPQGLSKRNGNDIQSKEAPRGLQEETLPGSSIKKQKIDDSVSIEFKLSGALFRSSEVSAMDEPGYPEQAWGRDRLLLRNMLIDFVSKFTARSEDSSILTALNKMTDIASSLKEHPGRSPAYRRAQFQIGQSRLMQMPFEIRSSIWKAANLPKLDCCLAGLKWHEEARRQYKTIGIANMRIAYVHLTKGRGLPVNRQILMESQIVAEPIGAQFCSVFCLDQVALAMVHMFVHTGFTYLHFPQESKQWMSLRSLKVPAAACTAQHCVHFCTLPQKSNAKEAVGWDWQYHVEGEFLVFERSP
ncbi:uncharacterized protein AB675_6285 [Cyphellophora attinorum]|uniref:Uncharacterized protein n=1 Tax=Cyphellophora attinorum TaxID=1664694 RepID=A0A0N1H9H0_9EURO|nr:uncharacterized protein AB675_6285 [Phialophora attinorum]KPI44142.1 hypothetical protein AB675_6285 [Phialophora attinorum]